LATKEPTGNPQDIAAALQQVTDRAQLVVREEIELAKAEVTEKIQKLVKGAVIGAVAGVFAIAALVLILHGFSWLAWWAIPWPGETQYFWGFFFVAFVLLVLGAIAGFVASRFFKSGSPPKPDMAIEEAQRIRETVQRAT
jgi:H+/Cl- antiporter ClcA